MEARPRRLTHRHANTQTCTHRGTQTETEVHTNIQRATHTQSAALCFSFAPNFCTQAFQRHPASFFLLEYLVHYSFSVPFQDASPTWNSNVQFMTWCIRKVTKLSFICFLFLSGYFVHSRGNCPWHAVGKLSSHVGGGFKAMEPISQCVQKFTRFATNL